MDRRRRFVIQNTEDADHPFTIKYPIYHAGVFGEIKIWETNSWVEKNRLVLLRSSEDSGR